MFNSMLEHQIKPDRNKFGQDPFGYSALAWHKWGLIQEISGFHVDLDHPPRSEDLKSPVLWLSQARAMSEAGVSVLMNEPKFDQMPELVKGVCDSQYCAVGLMLIGYSLEICLKAMVIMKIGIAEFTKNEKKHHHHKLEELAGFVPDLNPKDKAILQVLTHFVVWAGRYPDPGSGRLNKTEEIFRLSEKFKISARDLFLLASRIMGHAKEVAGAC
jgi:hypothetical protein